MLDKLQNMVQSAFSAVSRKRDHIISDLHTNLDNHDMDAARENVKVLARLHPNNQDACDAVCRIFKLGRVIEAYQIVDIAEDAARNVETRTLLHKNLQWELSAFGREYAKSNHELAVRAVNAAVGSHGDRILNDIYDLKFLANDYRDSPISAKDAVIYAYKHARNTPDRDSSIWLEEVVKHAEEMMRYVEKENHYANQYSILDTDFSPDDHITAIRDIDDFVRQELEFKPGIRHELDRNGRQIEERLVQLQRDTENLPRPSADRPEPRP